MSNNEQINPKAIETAHFEKGPGEVYPPRPYAEALDYSSGEVYTFPMPPAPVPEWVLDGVTSRRQAAIEKEE